MKTIIHFLLILIVFTSCSTSDKVTRKCHKAKIKYEMAAAKWGCPTIKDSTIVQSQIIIKDTTIYVPVLSQTVHDSIPVLINNGLINTPISTLETTYSRSKAWVENGILKHTLNQRPSTIPVILPGALHTSTSITVQTIKVPYYIERPISMPLHWWQKLFIYTGISIWLVVILYFPLKIYRNIIKPV
jgi:hypothetical protein